MLGLIVLTEPPGLTSDAGTRPSSPNGVPGVGTELSLSGEVSGAGTKISSSSQMEGLNKSYANMAGEGGSRLDLSRVRASAASLSHRRIWCGSKPYLFQAPAIRPSFARVSNFDRIHSLLIVIANYILGSKLLPLSQHECRYCPSCTHPFPFGRSSEVVLEHTLKLISYTNGGHHPFTLELEQGYHVYAHDSSTEGEVTWRTKLSPWANYFAVSSF
jgi:hypothetical protein